MRESSLNQQPCILTLGFHTSSTSAYDGARCARLFPCCLFWVISIPWKLSFVRFMFNLIQRIVWSLSWWFTTAWFVSTGLGSCRRSTTLVRSMSDSFSQRWPWQFWGIGVVFVWLDDRTTSGLDACSRYDIQPGVSLFNWNRSIGSCDFDGASRGSNWILPDG